MRSGLPDARFTFAMKGWLQYTLLGALLLGATGFACGFFGPIALNPDANQGPLLGIFITGPGGALLGAVLGAALGIARVRTRSAAIGILAAVCAVLGVVILYFCVPGPEYQTELVELEVLECVPPAVERAKAFARWEKAIARVDWAEPRPGWREDFDRSAAKPGAVLKARVERRRELFTERKPWKRGQLVAQAWTTANDRRSSRPGEYFAYASCDAWPPGTRGVFALSSEPSGGWPPESLPSFLDLRVIREVPHDHLPFTR